MSFFSKFARQAGLAAKVPEGPKGMRAYAIGDIHGRLDLLDQLLVTILDDIDVRPARRNFIVVLGDLIDRGPDSAGVVDRLRALTFDDIEVICLAGNHEDVFLNILRGDDSLIEAWLRFGGAECAASYGIDPARLAALDPERAGRAVRDAVPRSHVSFLSGLGDTFRFGDYLFVHAGIRPGVPLDRQDARDLRWVREPFLSDTRDHHFIVVHGHTIVDAVESHANRIAIDTGAYRTGRLTALAIEGAERRFLST